MNLRFRWELVLDGVGECGSGSVLGSGWLGGV